MKALSGTVDLLRSQFRSSARVRIGKLESSIYHLIIVPLVAFLPPVLAYGVAVLVGDLRYRFYREYREKVESALGYVFGERLSHEACSRAARDWYRVQACETIDVMRLIGNGSPLRRLVEIRGLEHVEAALAAGKGALVCTAHFGSSLCVWSLLGSLGLPICNIASWSYDDDRLSPVDRMLYRLLQNRPVIHHLRHPNIVRQRGKIGVAVQAAIFLRRNELVGIMIDHSEAGAPSDSAAAHMSVDFLGCKATLLAGAPIIARLTGAQILVALMVRSPDWRHQVLEISPPISMQDGAQAAFLKCLAILEDAIYRNPGHWVKWNPTAMTQLKILPTLSVSSTLGAHTLENDLKS